MTRLLAMVIACAALSAQDPAADARRFAEALTAGGQALAAGRLDEAERALVQASAFGPDIRTEILRSELSIARKDAAGAAASMAAAIAKLKPDGELARTAHRTRARALVELGSFREAAPVILESLGLGPAAAAPLAIAARGFAEAGDRRTAMALLGLAMRLDPARTDLLATRAAVALEDGDASGALRDAEARMALAPRDQDARVLRARALHALGRSMEARDALAVLDRLRALDPPLLRVLLALDLEADLLDDAKNRIRRLGTPTERETIALAGAWIERGDARAALDAIASLPEPRSTDASRLAAMAHLDLSEPDRAAEILRRIGTRTVDDDLLLARAERLAGRLEAAEMILAALLAVDPGRHEARVGLIDLRVAQGDLAAARRLLAEGLVLAPQHPAIIRALDDLVPELAPAESSVVTAVFTSGALTVDGARIDSEPSQALAQLRAVRVSFGPNTPALRLVLSGPLASSDVGRAFDLLAAAGFAKVSVESR